MGNMVYILQDVARTPDCTIRPPVGQPASLPERLNLPQDAREFYQECGGATLFASSAYSVDVLPPDQVVPANPVIVGEEFPEDRSARWVTVAALPNGDYITMDLDPERLGHCYDSSHEVHGVVGSCAVIATSFSGLLRSLLEAGGGYWYWLEDDFVDLGDAYD
jgi:hypothetical protein